MGIGENTDKGAEQSMTEPAENEPLSNAGQATGPGNSHGSNRGHSSIEESDATSSEDNPDEDRSEDAAARDSLAGDLALSIEPELGAPDAGGSDSQQG